MYEIWHNETNNIVDWFETASQAEDAILAALESRGEDILDAAYLVRDDGDDDVYFLAEGRNILSIVRILRLLDEVQALNPGEGELPGELDIAHLVDSLPSLGKYGSHFSGDWMKGFIAHGVLAGALPSTTDSGVRIVPLDSIRKMQRLIGQRTA